MQLRNNCRSGLNDRALTDRFAGPLSFAIPETHTLQHVVINVMRPLPSIPNFIGSPTLMATV